MLYVRHNSRAAADGSHLRRYVHVVAERLRSHGGGGGDHHRLMHVLRQLGPVPGIPAAVRQRVRRLAGVDRGRRRLLPGTRRHGRRRRHGLRRRRCRRNHETVRRIDPISDGLGLRCCLQLRFDYSITIRRPFDDHSTAILPRYDLSTFWAAELRPK